MLGRATEVTDAVPVEVLSRVRGEMKVGGIRIKRETEESEKASPSAILFIIIPTLCNVEPGLL